MKYLSLYGFYKIFKQYLYIQQPQKD